MLHRRVGDSLVLISQPAHAWISGQLADAWGNADVGLEPPPIAVRLAAEQHDVAWLEWEAAPTLNPETGLPYAFNQLPTLDHLSIWSTSTRRALAYGYLPAALISMHGTHLYERYHDFDADSDDEARAARAFLQRETEFQRDALERISAMYGLDAGQIQRYRQLVSAWDAMSLALCMGAPEGRQITGLPALDGLVDIAFQPNDEALTSYAVSPWPFDRREVLLACEGRVLSGTFDDEEAMRVAVRNAPVVRLEFRLVPG